MEGVRLSPEPRASAARASVPGWYPLLALPIVGVVLLSFLPYHDKVKLHTKGRFHYPGHILAFGGIAFLLVSAARTPRMRVFGFLVPLCLGLLLEYAQHVRYYEPVEWTDVLVDSLAVLAASFVATILTARRS